MTVEIYPVLSIRKLRQTLREKIAEFENAGNACRYLALLNTPLIPEERTSAAKKRVKSSSANGKPAVQTIEGTLGLGKTTPYAVEGRDFYMNDETWLFGKLSVGARVRVKYSTYTNSVPKAQSVQVLSQVH
jgi:hypothetical protein